MRILYGYIVYIDYTNGKHNYIDTKTTYNTDKTFNTHFDIFMIVKIDQTISLPKNVCRFCTYTFVNTIQIS